MTIEQAVASKLKAVLGHDRVYPDNVPAKENVWPCVVFSHAGDDEQFGLNNAPSVDHRDVFNLEIWGPDRLACARHRDTLKAAFTGVNCQGQWGQTETDVGVCVAGAFARDASADIAPAEDGSERHDRLERLTLTINWYG